MRDRRCRPSSPPLPRRKSGLPDLRRFIMRNRGKPRLRGGGSCETARAGHKTGPVRDAFPQSRLTRSHLGGPAPGHVAGAAGALRAVAAELIEARVEIGAVAAEAALGKDGGDIGSKLAG